MGHWLRHRFVTSTAQLVGCAEKVLDGGVSRHVQVRLLGGIAIWMRALPATRSQLQREYADLDMVAYSSQRSSLINLLMAEGFEPEKRFNAIHGERRLIFYSADRSFRLDIFLDRFEMSHTLDFRNRLEVEEATLPGAELLLTKLQVAQVNPKDLVDIFMLLADHALTNADGPLQINVGRIESLCASDWGLFTTVTDNLVKAEALLGSSSLDSTLQRAVGDKLRDIGARLRDSPKTLGWKVRAKVGRRLTWYEVPEEIQP